MAEITQQHTPVQTPVAKPKTAVPGQQTVYHVPPGQDHTSRQQPIQYHTPATGQSPPAGQQPAQYYAPSPGQPVTPRPLISTSQRPAVELDLDFDYLKTPAGALLCTEFVTILVAYATALYYKEPQNLVSKVSLTGKDSDLEFFVGAFISGWVVVTLTIFAAILGLQKCCGAPQNFHVVVLLLHSLWALLFIIGSGLMAKQAKKDADFLELYGLTLKTAPEPLRSRLIVLDVAVVFGFLSFVLFVASILLHFKFFWTKRKEPQYPAGALEPQYSGSQAPLVQPHPGTQEHVIQQLYSAEAQDVKM